MNNLKKNLKLVGSIMVMPPTLPLCKCEIESTHLVFNVKPYGELVRIRGFQNNRTDYYSKTRKGCGRCWTT